MPPRIARGSTSAAGPKTAKNKNRKRNLDAYAIASHSAPEKLRMRQHRLGETIDDSPRQKRRRLQDDDEDSEGEERIDSARMRQERNVTKRTGTGVRGGLGGANEDVEEGSDSSGNEWTVGGLAENDDDSELDSDEAFGSSDEERFEGFTFRGSKSSQKKPKKVLKAAKNGDFSLDEAESEAEEDDDESLGEDAVDLATMLDDDGDDEQLGSKDKTMRDLGDGSADDSGSEEDDEGSDGDSGDAMSDENDDHVDEEGLSRLRDFVDTLNDEVIDKKGSKKSSDKKSSTGQTLSLDDLLGTSTDPAVQKSIKAIQKPSRKAKGIETLAPALPKRQQDRLDREVASKKAKEQLDRWRDTVIQNRRAEFLEFPLADPNAKEPVGKDKFTSTSLQDKPRTQLEESIQKIMEESGMASKPGQKPADEEGDLLKSEELATNKLPVEEVIRRRNQLRKARELLFQEEKKAKRISKIKSKSYRRVHRKQREREAEKNRELMGSDVEEDDKERADRRRAEERMGAKHRDSKWARSVKASNRAAWDENAREGVQDMARRNEDLRKRIAGQEVSDDDRSEVSSDNESDDGGDNGDARTLKQLQKLKGGDAAPDKGLAGMKFMRAADERRRAQNDEDVERLRKELAGEDSDEADQDIDLGRAIFGPKASARQDLPRHERSEMDENILSGDEEDITSMAHTDPDAGTETAKQPSSVLKTGGVRGPLSRGATQDRRNPSVQQASQQEDAGDAVASSSWLAPKSKKSRKEKSHDAESEGGLLTTAGPPKAFVEASHASVTSRPNSAPRGASAATAGTMNGWQTVPYSNPDADDSDADSEAATQPLVSAKATDNKKSMHSRVFASDDVQTAFAAEKADLAASEDEKETSNHLPGWGSWTGSGLTKRTQKQNKKLAHNPLHKTKVAGTKQEHRRDKGRNDVIISERLDRKGKKYLAPTLPHGFEKGEEYERSMRVPVGPEWTTKETFQRSTKPRVVVKKGAVVEAMERPLV